MRELKQYNFARIELESHFFGLPYAPSIIITTLMTQADPYTGLVSNITYRDLAAILTIAPAPGRKNSGTPEKHVIRSYLRTIENQCGDDFQVISEQQQLKFRFPKMPAIYAKHFGVSAEASTHTPSSAGTATALINTALYADSRHDLNLEGNTEVSTESHTPGDAIMNVFIFNKNKHNKHTGEPGLENFKHPIAHDFYPSNATIQTALIKGLTKVLDMDEIQKFIWHNQDKHSQWPDFNPVFLWWLEREAEHRHNKTQAAPQNFSRSNNNEQRPLNQVSAFERTMEQVQRDNPNPWSPGSEQVNDACVIEIDNVFNGTAYPLGLDEADRHLQHAVYQ